MHRHIAAALVAAALPAAAVMAETYVCRVRPDARGAWIPATLIITYQDETGEGLVYDEIIKTFFDKPLPARVKVDNDKRITFVWTLPEFKVPDGATVLRFDFRATLLKKSRRIVVHSSPAGFDNEFSGRGRCRLQG